MLRLGWQIRQLGGILTVSCGTSILVIAVSAIGILQPLEWFAFDRFLRSHRSDEVDPRFLIVTIDEDDLQEFGEWPISDQKMATLLRALEPHQPRAIGIDVYRDLNVGTGRDQLAAAFRDIPNVIGVERVIGERVSPARELISNNQVGMADLVIDHDGRMRRGLLAIKCKKEQQLCEAHEDNQLKYGLGTKLALLYLEQEEIYPQEIDKRQQVLGKL